MSKIETITFEYNHCGECPNANGGGHNYKSYCDKKEKKINNLWGKIPKWCPLEDKVD